MKRIKYLLLLIPLLFISKVKALTLDTQDITWYYRKTSDETTLLNTIKDIDTPVHIVNGEYLNGFTTRQDYTFNKNLQYMITYKLRMIYYDGIDGSFRNDTVDRLISYSWVDSDFKLLNTSVNQSKYLCEADLCIREFTISQQVLTLNSTSGIRFGVYTTEAKSIGFYSPPTPGVEMYLSNTITIEDNSSSTIIDQNNQIIDGQNSLQNSITNTEDNINQNIDDMESAIVDSNKETQDVIKDQFNNCKIIDINSIYESGKRLGSNGNPTSNEKTGITDYITINENTKIQIINNSQGYYSCFYNSSKKMIKCFPNGDIAVNTDIEIPSNAMYFRATLYLNTGLPNFKICSNKIDETNDKLDNLTGAITDSSSPNTGALENSAGWLPPGPLDSVLNLPLSLFNALTTNLNKSCNPINIPLPYVNKNITLPCINTLYNQIGITSFLSWIGVIVSGLMLYTYLLKLYKWIEDRISLNETHNVDSWGGL